MSISSYWYNLPEKPNPTMDRMKEVRIGHLPKETTFISLKIGKREQDDLKAFLKR